MSWELMASEQVEGGFERYEAVGEGFDVVPARVVADLSHHLFDRFFDFLLHLIWDLANDFLRFP